MLETYASLEQVMRYYGTEERPGGHFPFNFLMIQDLNINSTAHDFDRVIHEWVDNQPSWGWSNWVVSRYFLILLTENILTRVINNSVSRKSNDLLALCHNSA